MVNIDSEILIIMKFKNGKYYGILQIKIKKTKTKKGRVSVINVVII